MLITLLAALLMLLSAAPTSAQDRGAHDAVLPKGSIVRLSIPDGTALWSTPLGASLQALLDGNEDIDGLRAFLHAATGLESDDMATMLLGGTVHVGVYRGPKSRLGGDAADGQRRVLVATTSSDEKALAQALERGLDALDTLGVDVSYGDYRGLEYARLDDENVLARLGDRLFFASHDELLADALDLALDAAVTGGKTRGRRKGKSAVKASDETVDGGLASFSFRVGSPLNRRGTVKGIGEIAGRMGNRLSSPLLSVLLDDAADELSAGGRIVGTLEHDRAGDQMIVQARLVPAPPDEDDEATDSSADDGARRIEARAPVAFTVPVDDQTLGVLHVQRDLADWWRHREERMPPEIQTRLARFDSTMSMLFSGQSLADDVFGQLGTSLAVVFDRQTFEDEDAAPDIRMPAACLVSTLDDPQRFAPMLQGAFQTFIGLINADRGQEGEAPFLIETERVDGGLFVSARLMDGMFAAGPMNDATDPGMGMDGAAPYSANLSPAMAVIGDRLLLGTSVEQVRRLMSALATQGSAAASESEVFGELGLSVDARILERALRDNRKALIAQNVIEKGNDPMQAAAEIDGLVAIVQRLRSVDVQLFHDAEGLRARLGLALDPATGRTDAR